MGLGSEAASSTRTNVREMPRVACCRAVCLRNRFSGALPQSKLSRSWNFVRGSSLRTHGAFKRFYGIFQGLTRFWRRVEQRENLAGILLGKPDNGLTLQYALGFLVCCLHHELIDGCAQKLR